MHGFQYCYGQWNEMLNQDDCCVTMEGMEGLQSRDPKHFSTSEEKSSKEQALERDDLGVIPDVLRGPPLCKRQYSISTIMEVIEDHNITDQSVMASPGNFQPRKQDLTRTAPIDIKRSSWKQNNCDGYHFGSTNSYSEVVTSQKQITAPSSDMRDCHQFSCSPALSAGSSSPLALPFANYRNTPPQSSSADVAGTPTIGQFQNAFLESTNEATLTSFLPTCYGVQESQPTVSPHQQSRVGPHHRSITPSWSMGDCDERINSYPAPGQGVTYDLCTENSLNRQRFVSTSSCPDFRYGDEMNFSQEGGCMMPGTPFPPNRVPSVPSMASDIFDAGSAFELEEVQTIPEAEHEELTHLDRTNRRRVRNNRACRASRLRRKLRKEETEKKAAGLADENMKLKKQIELLESECEAARSIVIRRMSET